MSVKKTKIFYYIVVAVSDHVVVCDHFQLDLKLDMKTHTNLLMCL